MGSCEQWLPVPGFEGYYEVSDHGHVRSLDRIVAGVTPTGLPCEQLRRGRMLTPSPDSSGHLKVNLSVDGVIEAKFVHQLVLEVFVGPRPDGLVACHYDDVKSNNHVSNLRWDTVSANSRDRLRNNPLPSRCSKGHEYAGDNLRFRKPDKNGHRERYCATCNRMSALASYHRRKSSR